MSYLPFTSKKAVSPKTRERAGSVRKAFSDWILENYGKEYAKELDRQRNRSAAKNLKSKIAGTEKTKDDSPTVGIIGGGFAGLYAGLILQSLGIESEVFESSDRVGGRIDTWYSTEYDTNDKNRKGLYGEVGGMRLPQFSDDMRAVQQLS